MSKLTLAENIFGISSESTNFDTLEEYLMEFFYTSSQAYESTLEEMVEEYLRDKMTWFMVNSPYNNSNVSNQQRTIANNVIKLLSE